ncbi:MAG: PIN domain-containing protein [Desulfobacterales bacterium]|nr:PIN domain-containing protein [Desulfobacterales bacterium]
MTDLIMYLLDTNIISYWMRGDSEVIGRIQRHRPSELALSAVSLAEILYGIEKSPIKKTERTTKIEKITALLEFFSFDESAARQYSVIRARLEKSGLIISERDLQIASIAKANRHTLVTHNTREFSRIAHLKVEDWAGHL